MSKWKVSGRVYSNRTFKVTVDAVGAHDAASIAESLVQTENKTVVLGEERCKDVAVNVVKEVKS